MTKTSTILRVLRAHGYARCYVTRQRTLRVLELGQWHTISCTLPAVRDWLGY